MRLYQTVSGGATSRFAYDGLDALAEYNAGGTLQRRWVYDPTTGQPLVWYEGSGTGNLAKRYLSSDERGSVISVSDSTGASLAVNSYDEYGIPGSSNLGRHGYTGQAWLPSMGVWHYKARIYHPALGFLQPDPIGYAGGLNMYAYTANNPINRVDPLGLDHDPGDPGRGKEPPVVCTGTRIVGGCGPGGIASGMSGFSTAGVGGQYPTGEDILLGRDFDLGGLSDAEIRSIAMAYWQAGELALAAGLPSDMRLSIWYGSQSGPVATFYNAGWLNGTRTFGSNPSLGQRNRFSPSGRITSAGAGGFMGAFEDLDFLAQLNGLTPPTPTGLVSLPPNGWSLSFNPHSGYQILTNLATGLTFRANGSTGTYRIDIPAGLYITINRDISTFPETVHYTGF